MGPRCRNKARFLRFLRAPRGASDRSVSQYEASARGASRGDSPQVVRVHERLRGTGGHRSANTRTVKRDTHLAALARDAPVHVVVVALDGGLALGDAPEVPGEHGADCEAHDGGEDPGHDEHDRGGAVAPVVLSAAAAGQMGAREE